jgi:UDP-N-acetylglucosamine:LPS N-acetylglucosamine transferase
MRQGNLGDGRTDTDDTGRPQPLMRDSTVERTAHPTSGRGDGAARRRVLLLTSGLGYGHRRASDAIREALTDVSPESITSELDFWSLMNPGVAETIQQIYLELVQHHSALYDRVHRLDEHTWRRILESNMEPPPEVHELTEVILATANIGDHLDKLLGPYPSDLFLFPTACAALPRPTRWRLLANSLARAAVLKAVWVRLKKRMLQHVRRFSPDVIVATQMVPAALVSALRVEHGLTQPTIGVLTDFGVHDFWVQPGTDLYCVPDVSMRGTPFDAAECARVDVTGVPLMPGFEDPPSAPEARTMLGLDPMRPVVLVLGGGLGIGVDVVATRLLAAFDDLQIIVMSAGNRDAKHALARAAAASAGRLRVRGWSDSMSIYFAAASIVVGKPGGLTVAEALASGRPLLATRSLRGQEGFNVRFLEQHGVGRLLDDAKLIQQIGAWLRDPAELEAVQQAAQRLGRRDGAVQVARHALELADRYREADLDEAYS